MGKQVDMVLPAVKLTFPDTPLGSLSYVSLLVFLTFLPLSISVYKLFLYIPLA